MTETPEINGKQITLAGKTFAIPELAIRQKKVVIPKMLKLFPLFAEKHQAGNMFNLSESEWDDLIDIVFIGVQKGLPHLTKESFLDLNIDLKELFDAVMVVAEQAGMKQAEPGEAQGVQSLPSTSTP